MIKEFSISIVLDERRQKKDFKFPVKLRVFTPQPRKQKLYATIFNFTKKEFESIWLTVKPNTKHKDNRLKLQAIENEANEIAEKLPIFNFEDFERLMYHKTTNKGLNVNFYFDKLIERKLKKGNISSGTSYKNALDCILRFAEKESLSFRDVTVSFIEQFETFCSEKEQKTTATISIYLRNLRAVFNAAIKDKAIQPDIYPFGKGKYQIKSGGHVKKALNREQINILFHGVPQTPEQEKAKAFWFFSYLCNGMNFKDILNLRYKNITDEYATFFRKKTEHNTHTPKPIKVFFHPFALEVIEKYGNPNKTPNSLVFDVLNDTLSPEDANRVKQNFIRFVNQHFLRYAKSLGINEKISTYWARHSFSTALLRKGKSVALIGEALGHTDIKTTMNYLDGFEDDDKKAIVNDLLD